MKRVYEYEKPILTCMGNIKEITFGNQDFQCSNGDWVNNPNWCDRD